MRRSATTAAVVALAIGGLTVAAPAYAEPPGGGAGCKEFGENVSRLARGLGPEFGDAASDAATSGPGNFPRFVVAPEKAAECSS